MKTKTTLTFLLVLLYSCGFGQINHYSYKRELIGINEQWHSIVLPNEIFGKISPSFSDIRIYGITTKNDTVEAPYLLKLSKEKTVLKEEPFTLINQSKNEKGYYFTFETPVGISINQIDLDFKQQDFDWRISLEGSQNLQEWFSIIEDYRILSIKNELTYFQFKKVIFPRSKYRYFRLFIKSDNKPDLVSAKLFLTTTTEGNYRKYVLSSLTIDSEKINKQSILDVELESFAPVNKLKINVKSKTDFYRPITIKYLSDSVKTEKGWRYNYSTLMSGTLNSVEKNEFTFNSALLQKLKIIIDNQDNEPLEIESVEVQGYVHKLVARFIEPATYYLTYGNKQVARPKYDIERFTEKIPSSLTELKLGTEVSIEKSEPKKLEPLFKNKNWLWAIMTIVIVLLGWFTLKMMKQK